MARLPRLVVPNQPHHILQNGIDRQPIFRDVEDCTQFLGWLREAARQFKVAVHAYVLLPAQLQLLLSPSDTTGLARMMQWVGRYYVPYFNAKYQRAGTLWQSRYRATVIDSESYFLTCSQYIELSPVRLGLAGSPAEYAWSSHAHHAGTRSDPLIHDHPVFWALGNTPFEREAAYRQLIDQGLSEKQWLALETAIAKGWPLGSEKFLNLLAKQASRRVSPARRGRPARPKAETAQE
ncbi:transposase [Noviherbaspirillum aerium]|uniref:transposase n=1 Tax=Noviherbaspirillum aerium TaxID=2588497 RepID=UPI00124CC422|nr:transposase [Noviherbaspirillum aerium]